MKILIYPKDTNPYQKLLYSNIKNHKTTYIKETPSQSFNLLLFPFLILYYRLLNFKIFHLHWQNFNLPFNNKITKKISYIYSIFCIKLIKLLRFKLIWTIHNLLPHKEKTSNDSKISKLLCKASNAKIVHSKQTIKDMKKYKFNTENTFIIPHGNYIGVYPNDKKNTKKEFGYSKKDLVFLFLGRIRGYKGIPELVKTFSKTKNKNAKLLITGNCKNKKTKNLINKYLKKDSRIKFIEGFVKDSDIQKYMNASDVCIYPFREITTSGSVILGSSFAKPVIYPKIGALKDFPDNIGFSYDNKNKNGLLNAMKNAIKNKNKLEQYSKKSFNYAKKLSWEKISKMTLKLYTK